MSTLIESDFPFPQLSRIAKRESWRKEIYRPVYYLHKWWARRLGSVFRGILLGAAIDESEDFWELYYANNDFGDKIVFDPFMGSGVVVGEATKLGFRAIGRDINQVAYLSVRAALSKYSRVEVLNTFRQLEKTVAPKLLSYFATKTRNGDDAIVLYYFLVKVVTCPKCNQEIELFSSRVFSQNAVPKKDPTARSICPVCGMVNLTTFDAETTYCPECDLVYDPHQGNVKGAQVTCNHCQHIFRLIDRMKQLVGPLGYRRYAKLILTHDGMKLYEVLNENDRALERHIASEFAEMASDFPKVAVAPGYNTNQMLKHNYKYWHQMFSDRQLVCIKQMVEAIKSIDQQDLRLLFSCLFSGVLEFNNLFTSFKGEGTGAVRPIFAHHILKPETMPLEANIWGTSKSSGAFSCLFHSRIMRALAYKSEPFELRIDGSKSTKVHNINKPLAAQITNDSQLFMLNPDTVHLSYGDSSATDLPTESVDLVVTDPPFFDNVHYSQLADFFYYWLNQMLDISSRSTTRSPNEVQDTNPDSFTSKLTNVFAECNRVLRPYGLFIFTYHHARHEGWTAIHQAIRQAGFVCVQSYPIKAEMSVSIPLQQARSPIHLDLILVCRKDLENKIQPNGNLDISAAISATQAQVAALRKTDIQLSLGDIKVILMGRLLCELHSIRNLKLEKKLLDEISGDIDLFVSQIVTTQGEVLYEQAAHEPIQLTLFEKMEDYLIEKRN